MLKLSHLGELPRVGFPCPRKQGRWTGSQLLRVMFSENWQRRITWEHMIVRSVPIQRSASSLVIRTSAAALISVPSLVPSAQLGSPALCGQGLPFYHDFSSSRASCPFCLLAVVLFQRQRVWVWKCWKRGRLLQRPRRKTQPGRSQQKPVQLGQWGLWVHSYPK